MGFERTKELLAKGPPEEPTPDENPGPFLTTMKESIKGEMGRELRAQYEANYDPFGYAEAMVQALAHFVDMGNYAEQLHSYESYKETLERMERLDQS